MTDSQLREKIYSDELNYNNEVMFYARLLKKMDIKILLLAGPSCAGKTTTSERLRASLCENGIETFVLSLDDFYLTRDLVPKTSDGKPDFESVYALDLPYIRECFVGLMTGQTVQVPTFDFNLHGRTDVYKEIKLKGNSMCIVEGLHALNPVISDCATGSDRLFKIYLDSYSDSDKPDATRVIRRLVRDYHYRSSDANRTFELWDNVIESERINIRPFSRYANATINTYFDYEKAALKAPLIEVLNTLKPGSIYTKKAEELRRSMESVNEIPLSYVPSDSLLQEFIPPLEIRNRYTVDEEST